jgi:hypothetical protein
VVASAGLTSQVSSNISELSVDISSLLIGLESRVDSVDAATVEFLRVTVLSAFLTSEADY